MNRRLKQVIAGTALIGLWLLVPEMVYADNCSSLNDCYYTLRAALAASVGLGVFAALMAIGLDVGPLASSVRKRMKNGSEAEGIATGEQDEWDRSLGVVPVSGLTQQQMTPQAKSSDTQSEKMSQEPAPGGTGSEGPEAMRPTSKVSGAAGSEQGQTAESRSQSGMSQSPAVDAPAGESARTEQGISDRQPVTDRSPEQMRRDIDTTQGSGGRSGEWAGEIPEGSGDVADSGDVVDRAQDVAEAFDDQQRMTQQQAGAEATLEPETSDRLEQIADETSTQRMKATDAEARAGGEEWVDEADSQRMSQTAPEGRQMGQQTAKMPDASVAQGTGEGGASSAATDSLHGGQLRRMGGQDSVLEGAGSVEVGPDVTQWMDGLSETARHLWDTYSDLRRLPGMQKLVDQVATNGIWAVRGAGVQLLLVRNLGQLASEQGNIVTRLEDEIGGRAGADITLEDGALVEVKNYYWNGPYFQNPENISEATRRLVRQIDLLRRRYGSKGVRLAFSELAGMPVQMVTVLQSLDIQVLQVDGAAPQPEAIAGEAFVSRLRQSTVEAYGRALLRAGWSDTSAGTARRLRAAFDHDPGSAWLALAALAFDGESVYETKRMGESYTALLELLAKHSEGSLRPQNIVEEVQGDRLILAFESAGRSYERSVVARQDYFDVTVLEMVNEALGVEGEARRFVPLPTPDQLIYLAFAPENVMEGLRDARLIPNDAKDRSVM